MGTAPRKKRKPNAPPSTYRCEGVHGCGATMTCSAQEAERHADTHGGARLALVLAERATIRETTTEEGAHT